MRAALALVVSLASAASPAPAPAQQPPMRALFVGNSFTFRNDLPGLVTRLGASLQPAAIIETGMIASDGMSLDRHWRDGEVLRRLRDEKWDVLVLQERSSRPLTDPAGMEADLRRFAAAAREAGVRAILYETWARLDEPETHAPRVAVHRRLAREVGVELAPVGQAWALARERMPGVVLHDPDRLHGNPAGTYLAAAVLLGVITGRNPEDARAPAREEPEHAGTLRAVARQALAESR